MKRIIPEVIQTSAMDCGPACLASLLGGFGVTASYERLREACRTDVDGTSIDTIEEAAIQLGLGAEQNLVPADEVVRAEAAALPAIVIVREPSGSNHFIVVWSRRGSRLQVMDPAVGRRWLTAPQLVSDLYVHTMDLPAAVWRGWMDNDERTAPLRARLRELAIADGAQRVDRALADPTWRSIATLDAAARFVQQLVDAAAIGTRETTALLDAVIAAPSAIPDDAWSAKATDDPDTLRVRGAVIVKITGYRATTPTSSDLQAALAEKPPRPWRHLAAAASAAGRVGPIALTVALALTAGLVVVQAMLWRALFDTPELTRPQLGGALATLVVFLGLELAIEAVVSGAVLRMGRRIDLGLRMQVLDSIGRLGLRYIQSRPASDLVERSHVTHRVRELPLVGAQLLRTALTALVTAAALIVLEPTNAPLVTLLVLAALAPPLLAHRKLAERELRARTHFGAIAQFFLDALLGAVASRCLGAERTLRREHEHRLVEWTRAARREQRLAAIVVALQAAIVCACAIALVARHVATTDRPVSVLLAVYWTVAIASAGGAFAALVRELPAARNQTLRLLEPLDLAGDRAPTLASAPDLAAGDLELRGVSVVAGGHPVLAEVSLTIPAGQHVAIVGASGAGKSTLLGLLLGWHRPATGTLHLGSSELDEAAIAALRARTVWIDPTVRVWNESLLANLTFGANGPVDLGAIVVSTGLDDVLGRLPAGMQTSLGVGGALLSGGEAQRVRLGRGLARRDPLLVLLDEPFRGIDRPGREVLLDAARERWRGTTLLCATHDLADTRGFDRVLVVEAGAIIEDDTPASLAANAASRYAQLLAEDAAALERWRTWRTITLKDGRAVEVTR